MNSRTTVVRVSTPASLKSERIQLRNMPGWTLSEKQTTLRRTFRFPTQKQALAFLVLALATAERASGSRRGPIFKVHGEAVTVTLSAQGRTVTGTELDLARSVSLSA